MNLCYVAYSIKGGVTVEVSIGIKVDYYIQPPQYNADNREDFNGYIDLEWEVVRTDIFVEETGEFLYSETIQDVEVYGVTEKEIYDWLLEQIEQLETGDADIENLYC